MRYFLFFLAFLFLNSCMVEPKMEPTAVKTFGEQGVNVIIEIPAGTNHKLEFNNETKQFDNDQQDGKDRVIDFLPYPGNYGFIPGTLMDKAKGGDGDALDVLVVCESLPTGTSIEVLPIAALELLDGGEIDTKLIAVPVDSTLRVIQSTNFEDFMIEYNIAQRIIKDWFLNYKGLGVVEMVAWKDEKFAMQEVKKWAKSKK